MAPALSGSVLTHAVRGSIFNGLGTIATFLIGFLFAGLTIRFLGDAKGGYLMTIQALTGMNALIGGFGLGTPAIRQIAIFCGEDHHEKARVLVGSVLTAMAIPALILTVLIVAVFPWVFGVSRLDAAYRTEAFWATLFVACSFLLAQVATPWQSVYPALQRYDLAAGLATVFGLASGIFGVITLRLMPTMDAIALVGLVLAMFRLVCDALLTTRLLKGMPRPTWCWSMIRPLLRFGGWTYLGTLGNFLFTNLDRLVLTTFLGSAAMPYYVLPQRIYSQVHTALASQSQFLFPMFSALGENARAEIERLEDRLRWFIGLLSTLIYGGLALTGPLILAYVVSADYARMATLPILLACVQGFFHAQEIVPYFNSWALGIGAPNTVADLANGVLVILSAIVLVPRVGYVGLSWAQLWIIGIALAHTLWARNLISPRAPKFAWLRAYASPVILMAVWATVVGALTDLLPDRPVFYLSSVAVGGLIGLATVWLVENRWFRRYNRWATLERAIAIPLIRLKEWVFAR